MKISQTQSFSFTAIMEVVRKCYQSALVHERLIQVFIMPVLLTGEHSTGRSAQNISQKRMLVAFACVKIRLSEISKTKPVRLPPAMKAVQGKLSVHLLIGMNTQFEHFRAATTSIKGEYQDKSDTKPNLSPL